MEAGASAGLTVQYDSTAFEATRLADANLDGIIRFGQVSHLSQPVRDALAGAVQRRQALADAESQIAGLDQQAERIAQEQARIRQNMPNLEFKSDLYKRYVRDLDAQENQLAQLRTRREALDRERLAMQSALSQYLSTLDIP